MILKNFQLKVSLSIHKFFKQTNNFFLILDYDILENEDIEPVNIWEDDWDDDNIEDDFSTQLKYVFNFPTFFLIFFIVFLTNIYSDLNLRNEI